MYLEMLQLADQVASKCHEEGVSIFLSKVIEFTLDSDLLIGSIHHDAATDFSRFSRKKLQSVL